MEAAQNVLHIVDLRMVDREKGTMYARFFLDGKEYEIFDLNVIFGSDEQGLPKCDISGEAQTKEDVDELTLQKASKTFCSVIYQSFQEIFKKEMEKQSFETGSSPSMF